MPRQSASVRRSTGRTALAESTHRWPSRSHVTTVRPLSPKLGYSTPSRVVNGPSEGGSSASPETIVYAIVRRPSRSGLWSRRGRRDSPGGRRLASSRTSRRSSGRARCRPLPAGPLARPAPRRARAGSAAFCERRGVGDAGTTRESAREHEIRARATAAAAAIDCPMRTRPRRPEPRGPRRGAGRQTRAAAPVRRCRPCLAALPVHRSGR